MITVELCYKCAGDVLVHWTLGSRRAGWGHCFVFLGKYTLYFHFASFNSGV